MKKIIILSALAISFVFSVSAQKIDKPKLTPQPPTGAQMVLIDEGKLFRDGRRYDEAIRKFEQVLQENPDCVLALYELSLTLYNNKPDKAKADEVARRGAQYKSELLPLFYVTIANVLDDNSQGEQAIEVYKDAIKMLKGEKNGARYLAEANYELAFAYTRQKRYPEARSVLKDGLEANFSHPASHLLLAQIYTATGYKVPGLLAASRFMGLEQNNPGTKKAAGIILDILKEAKKDDKGEINIFLNFGAPKDEGDFGMYEFILGTLTTFEGEENKNKTENERFAGAVSSLTEMLVEDKKLRSTFVGKTYIPYLEAMKKSGHHQTFAFVVLQQGGNKDAAKWLEDNPRKLSDYFAWAKHYLPSGK